MSGKRVKRERRRLRGDSRFRVIFDELADWPQQQEETMDTLGDFGWALECLKGGLKVQRSGWNGPGQFLQLQVPDEHSKMTLATLLGHDTMDE